MLFRFPFVDLTVFLVKCYCSYCNLCWYYIIIINIETNNTSFIFKIRLFYFLSFFHIFLYKNFTKWIIIIIVIENKTCQSVLIFDIFIFTLNCWLKFWFVKKIIANIFIFVFILNYESFFFYTYSSTPWLRYYYLFLNII